MSLSRFAIRTAGAIFACFSILLFMSITAISPPAWAQDLSTGSLNVAVLDPSGAAIAGATIVLKDLGTNDVHTGVTRGVGTVVIPYLPPAQYILTVSKDGFETEVYPLVTIQTNQVSNLKVAMKIGAATTSISVSSDVSPILDSTSNALTTTLDLKQVDSLPLGGRDAGPLAFLVPGAVNNNFNNLPGGAVNVSSNGFSTMTARNKSSGFADNGSATTQLLEDTQEMTVQTSELDASHGGSSTMDIGFTTKRGTNKFHGQLFEDYRSRGLNANTWYNNYVGLPRPDLIIHDFGASVGGPLWKDKLFFFVSLSNFRQPSSFTHSTEIPTAAALAGNYSYIPTGSSAVQTVNVLQAGASAGCPTCTGQLNPTIAAAFATAQASYGVGGATITPLDLNHNNLNFPVQGATVIKYPTARLDYDVSHNFRLTGTANETASYYTNTGAPPYPGAAYANQSGSSFTKNWQATAGFDWSITPSFVNAFRAAFLYTHFEYNTQGVSIPTDSMFDTGNIVLGFGLTSGINPFNSLSGGSLYDTIAVKDDSTWQKGNHTIGFGVEAGSEPDHYYNNLFVPSFTANGIATGDPVQNALINALSANAPSSAQGDVQGLYASLTGRVNYYSTSEFVNTQTKQYDPHTDFDLHERLTQAALFAMDSWRATPTLTLNYGLRWDFTGASTDLTGFYTHPDVANLWGPSGVNNLFMPGTLSGVQNPTESTSSQAYAPTYVHPQPNFGFAWSPHGDPNSWTGRMFGNGKTVIRGSYTLKNYVEGTQNFWTFGSNGGANFQNNYTAVPVIPSSAAPGAGFYNAGSFVLGQSAAPATAAQFPVPFSNTVPLSLGTFSGNWVTTIDPHIKQPYVESWQFGIQYAINDKNVIEVRYVGNVGKDQWLGQNINEINVFENGFLNEFKGAQANLVASGGTTFQGHNPTPILNQAFASTGLQSNFTNSQFITWLNQGQAGAFANYLASNPSYLCSLVGAAHFAPCGAAGATGGGGYPINFFQANPFVANGEVVELTNAGYSNYNALQIDFRQHSYHGMQFNANYTYAKSLGTSVQGSTAPGIYGGQGNSAPGFYTLRNKRLNYFPSAFDIRNVLHVSGTYDLPFGRNRQFFSHTNRVVDSVIGGWTLGTIITYQSGDPHLFNGGTETTNTSDSGISLIGVTPAQLQKQIHIRPSNGHPWVNLFDPKYYTGAGQANNAYISPNFNAGTFAYLLWLHDPKWINTDAALTKVVPVYKSMNLTLQAEFLNVFNHTAWNGMDTGVQDTTFGTTSTTANSPRNIELRGNFRF